MINQIQNTSQPPLINQGYPNAASPTQSSAAVDYHVELVKNYEEIKSAEKEFYELLSNLAKHYFEEPLSELGKRRQALLFISAIAAILVSGEWISPLEGNIQGFKFQFSDPQVVEHLAGALCVYFLLTFLIGAMEDRQRHYYDMMPMSYQIRDISNRIEGLTKIRKNIQMYDWLQRVEKVGANARQKNSVMYKKIIDTYLNTLSKIEKGIDNLGKQKVFRSFLFPKTPLERLEQIFNLFRSMQQVIQKQELEVIQKLTELDPTIDTKAITPGLRLYILEPDYDNRLKQIVKAQRTHRYYRKLRGFFEIGFPTALALYAIYVSLIR